MRRLSTIVCLSLMLLAMPLLAAQDEGIPARPEQLEYSTLEFDVPDADQFRHELSNGIVVYVGEDRALPLVDISVLVRTGSYLDSKDKPGVAALTGRMIRRGGTMERSAEEFDEAVDFLAAQMGSYVGDTQGGASMNCTSQTLDECLDLFFEMLRRPGFDASRLELERTNILEQMKQRNDDAQDIARREWDWLMRGDEHFSSRRLTRAELEAITREDLVSFHQSYFQPQNMILTVSGNVETEAVLAALEEKFADWPGGDASIAWPPPPPKSTAKPGVYYVDKDIPQGRVRIGHPTIADPSWSHPDRYAIAIMNEILGGGGFTSRLTKRIRSDEGLAYSAGSALGIGSYMPGTFTVYYQSKSATVALAAQIALDEIARIRKGQVSEEELAVAKAAFIDTFPQNFESVGSIVRLYAQDEYLGRSHGYWKEYRENYRKVGVEDVQHAAQRYLHPDELVFLIVGDWSSIQPGDADDRASMELFYGGRATERPLRDPMTLEPLP